MGLFGINNELEFLICNYGESHANSQQKWQGELFYKGEREAGMATVNKESMAFHWISLCQEGRGIFLLPVGLCYRHQQSVRVSCVWSPDYLFEISVY